MELWFNEDEGSRLRISYKISEVLFHETSAYQTVQVFRTEAYGLMLVIDGFVMLTEADEFVYHEMLGHVPALLHESPKRVIVVGGGDGGTVRELLKHDCIEEIVLCEIDQLVIDVAKRHFPNVSIELENPRVQVRVGDGVAYMKDKSSRFDLALIDSTDPVGPGEGLFTEEFYRSVAKALRPGGIMAAQSESPWMGAAYLERIHRNIDGGFANRASYIAPIPTYPRGLWSWTIGSNQTISPANYDRQRFSGIAANLQYLSKDKVVSCFDLPPFYRKKITF